VLDEAGAPVPGVTVTWGVDVDRPLGRVQTGADGAYCCEGLERGDVELRAGGGDEGLARMRVSLPAAGPPVRVDLRLEKGAAIRGKALGAAGEPLAGHAVEFTTDDGTWADACTTRADGTFELPNQPGASGWLSLARSAGDVPIALQRDVTAGGDALVLDLRSSGPAGGAIVLRTKAQEPVPALEVSVWHVESGRGRVFAHADGDAFLACGLAPGHHRVEARAPGLGRVELGELWVDGRSRTDLGTIALPQPAELRLVLATGAALRAAEPAGADVLEETAPASASSGDVSVAAAWSVGSTAKIEALDRGAPALRAELYARRSYGDVRAEDARATSLDRIALPAGEWLLLWQHSADGPVRSAVFRAQPAAQVTVDLR
jgi:hypothetical protein